MEASILRKLIGWFKQNKDPNKWNEAWDPARIRICDFWIHVSCLCIALTIDTEAEYTLLLTIQYYA